MIKVFYGLQKEMCIAGLGAWCGPKPRKDGGPQGAGCGSLDNDWLVPDKIGSIDFLPACQKHDKCYSTCGKTKNQCDNDFHIDLLNECNNSNNKDICYRLSHVYYTVITFDYITMKAYKNAQNNNLCLECK